VAGVKEAMSILTIDRMPTSAELRSNNMTWLDSLIGQNGGLVKWADKLNLPLKRARVSMSEKEIKEGILTIKKELGLDRMPSRSEIIAYTKNNSLHNHIVRSKGYRGWAKALSLSIKESETKTGQDFEEEAMNILIEKGFSVEKMPTKHPFDLLINGTVKVDVKSGRAYMLRGSRCHSFGINKNNGSCDLYMILALDEKDKIERTFIVPSHHLKVTTLSIGENSKYNRYIGKFSLMSQYSDFHQKLEIV